MCLNSKSLSTSMKPLLEVYETSLQPLDQGCFSTKHGNITHSSSRSKEAENRNIIHSSSRSKEAESRFINLTLNTTVEYTNGLMTHGEMEMPDFGISSPTVQPFIQEGSDESLPASCRGNPVCSGSLSVSHLNCSNRDKGKEQATSDSTEGSKCASGESEDSHNSVESSSSKRLLYIGKRGRNYGMEMLVQNKRQKKQVDEASMSGSFQSQGGSFMNWVATITNGFSRFSDATPLAVILPPSQSNEGDLNCQSLSDVKGKNIHINFGNMGFKSIFQSLYLPGSNLKTGTNVPLPAIPKDAKELHFETAKFGYIERQSHCEKMELNLQDLLPSKGEEVNVASKHRSCSERLNVGSTQILCDEGTDDSCNVVSMPATSLQKDSHQVNDRPTTESNTMPGVSISRENTECGGGNIDVSDIIGSLCSSPKNKFQSPSAGNGVNTHMAVAGSSSMFPNNVKKDAFQNLWISRFSRKASSAKPELPNSAPNMDSLNLTTESLTAKYDTTSRKHQDCLQKEANGMDAKNLESLHKGKQVLTPPLNPVLPLHEFQKKEPVASTFTKRLEMRRKSEPSKVQYSTTCFFCGKIHHTIGECS